jgi:hypothetical protein
MDYLEQLAKLGELRAQGLLSDAEFEQQKAVLLQQARKTLPPPSAPTAFPGMVAAPPQRRRRGKVGCLSVLLTLLILVAIGAAVGGTPRKNPSSGDTVSAVVDSSVAEAAWYPAFFTPYDDSTAFRYADKSEYECTGGFHCAAIFVVARDGCESLYAEIAVLDSSGTNIGFSNDTTTGLQPGQQAKLTFDILEDATAKIRLTTINCF